MKKYFRKKQLASILLIVFGLQILLNISNIPRFVQQVIAAVYQFPPSVGTIQLTPARAGSISRNSITISDRNMEDVLTYSITGLPSGITQGECVKSFNQLYQIIKCPIEGVVVAPGAYPITIAVKDDKGGSASNTILLTVENDSRVIPNFIIPVLRVGGTLSYKFQIKSTDTNANDTLDMKISGLPQGLSISSCNQSINSTTKYKEIICTISGKPTQVGQYTLHVQVTDGMGGESSKTLSGQVLP